MKRIILLVSLFISSFYCSSQENRSQKMGKVSLEELKMKFFEKDSSVGAVVLDEKVFIYSNPKKYYSYTRDYYVRIKFFNKEELDRAKFKIHVFKPSKYSSYVRVEGISDVKGITYNLSNDGKIIKETMDPKDAIIQKIDDNNHYIIYLLPKVNEGSVIEFKYTYTTRDSYILDQRFQSNIPKLKVDYKLLNATNYDFYIRLNGLLKPSFKEIKMKKKCIKNKHECYYVHYIFDSVPAFHKEKYMTSSENFISKLTFTEEFSVNSEVGVIKGWKAIDKRLKSIYLSSINKSSFFKKRIPQNSVNNGSRLKIANEIFKYIQNHYAWNKKIGLYKKVNYNKAFKEKVASVSEINMSLLNALRAYNFDANIGLLSTRNNGKITKLHPTPNSFKYLVVAIEIEGKKYVLDASRKNISFGQLPYECLNDDVRIFNLFKDHNYGVGSYWQKIKPISNNKSLIKSRIEFIPESEKFEGKISIKTTGYYATDNRKKIKETNNDLYLESLESENVDLEIENYKNFFLDDVGKALQEEFHFNLYLNDISTSNIKVNPFLLHRYKTNPFKMKERLFPINYGHNRSEIFYIYFMIPDGYVVIDYPKDIKYNLPGNGGSYVLKVKKDEKKISILSQLQINKAKYLGKDYNVLKELYNTMVKAQSSHIVIQKK